MQGEGSRSHRVRYFSRDDLEVHDNKNEYSIGVCSFEYLIFILVQAARREIQDNTIMLRFMPNLGPSKDEDINSCSDREDWILLLPLLTRLKSLKIKSNQDLERKTKGERPSEIYANSYEFRLMKKYETAIRRLKSYNDITFRVRVGNVNDTPDDSIRPTRRYDVEPVDYYRLALASENPYLQYISYYHVLEYYFPRAFRNKVANTLRDVISGEDFNLSDTTLFKLAKKADSLMKSRAELGFGNEKDELDAVLEKYIEDIETIRNSLPQKTLNALSNNVPFQPDAKSISWSGGTALSDISTRVYKTRNALIHSKESIEGANHNKPFFNEDTLRLEVPLVKALAEQVIERSGEVFQHLITGRGIWYNNSQDSQHV